VAVGDVHGAYDRFTAILRAAGIVDSRLRWAGGRTVFVQTGDVVDRGPDSRRALDLLRRLEGEAQRAGGRVLALIGNHEVMVMLGDFRYVSAGDYASHRSRDAEDLRDRYYRLLADQARKEAGEAGKFDEAAFRKDFLARTPLGLVEMIQALGPKGDYGAWLRARPTMARVNGIAFMHGGLSPSVAALGCAGVNAAVEADMRSIPPDDPGKVAGFLATREDGPLWFRGLALEDETAYKDEMDRTLDAVGARAIVIGHTVTGSGRIASRFGGRVLQIDTGMLGGTFFPKGRASALEIQDGKLTAIYEDGRETLTITVPPPAPGAAGR
jgi:hypothetical protein